MPRLNGILVKPHVCVCVCVCWYERLDWKCETYMLKGCHRPRDWEKIKPSLKYGMVLLPKVLTFHKIIAYGFIVSVRHLPSYLEVVVFCSDVCDYR